MVPDFPTIHLCDEEFCYKTFFKYSCRQEDYITIVVHINPAHIYIYVYIYICIYIYIHPPVNKHGY
jgi:hypothetical protein